ncbi:MAG: HPr family phosphocarrier protein [Elusimicrobiota bacterium]
MEEKNFTVKNKLGFHARAAAMLVENISKYSSDVTIVKNGREVDGKSIMGIMTLAAGQGANITVRAEGEDENEVLEKIEELIERKFDED